MNQMEMLIRSVLDQNPKVDPISFDDWVDGIAAATAELVKLKGAEHTEKDEAMAIMKLTSQIHSRSLQKLAEFLPGDDPTGFMDVL